MAARTFLLFVVIIGCLRIDRGTCYGQNDLVALKAVARETGKERESDLQITTGLSFGLRGPEVFYNFQLADENGFKYDTWSLLQNSDIAAETGLTPEQLTDLTAIRDQIQQEMVQGITTGIASEEGRAELKQKFFAAEAKLLEVMQPEQLQRFELARDRLNMQQVGIAQYLKTQAAQVKYGLSDADVAVIESAASAIESQTKQSIQDSYREANLELIDALPKRSRDHFEEQFSAEDRDKYLHLPLFTSQPEVSRGQDLRKPDILRMVALGKTLRDSLDLRDGQLEKIKSLKSRRDAQDDAEEKVLLENQLRTILDEHQYQRLIAGVTHKEAARWGTVNSLCSGLLGRTLDVPEEERDRLYLLGIELQERLPTRLQQAKTRIWRESLGSLPSDSRDKVLSLINDTGT